MSPRRLFLLLVGAAALAACACRSHSLPREATFLVDLGQRAPGEARVQLRLPPPRSEIVILDSFLEKESLRISPVRAHQQGKELAVEAERSAGGTYRWKLRTAPSGGIVTVDYTVRPGAVEEKANSGPTGRRLGYLNPRFGIFSGRQIFLLPEKPESPDRARIRFLSPEGEEVVAPWRRSGKSGDYVVALPAGVRRLREGVMGVGRFEKGASPDGKFRVFASKELPAEERRAALRRALGLYSDLSSRMGCQGDYQLLLVPKSPEGMIVSVPPGPDGEGISLGEGIPTRWLGIGRNLGRACLGLGEPARGEGKEAWFVEGLPVYLTVLHSDTEGWRSRRSWLERFYYDTQGSRIDLRVPPPAAEGRRPWERRAALALDRLSRELQSEGLPALEISCARILAGKDGVRRYLKEDLPAGLRTRLDGWLSPDPGSLPFPSERGSEPPRALTSPPAIPRTAPRAARLDLYLSGRNLGLLEQCGCRSKQVGGFARRVSVLKGRLRGSVASLVLELGDVVPFDAASPMLDRQMVADSDLSFELLARSGARASVVGFSELSYGPAFLKKRAARLPRGFRLLSANVSGDGLKLAGSEVFRGLPLPVRVFGAVDQDAYGLGRPLEFEDAIAGLRWIPPAEALAPGKGDPAKAELRAVAGPLGPSQVLEILRRRSDLALILTDDYEAFRRDPRISFPESTGGEYGMMGMRGETLVAALNGDSHALIRLGLLVSRRGGIAGAEMEGIPLDASVPDDPGVRARLDRHYEELARESGLREPAPLGKRLARRLDADYVGEEACAACHTEEARSWGATPHAAAFATLLERHRQGVPTCVACHVTGYGEDTGYRGMEDVRLRHVQCEACHGPGSHHLALPVKGTIIRVPEARDCMECHDSKHSEMNEQNFPEYWARIVHDTTTSGQ